MDNRFGFTYPGWNIVDEIGRGSFGAVYEIERKIGGIIEKAALKRMTIPQNKSEIKHLRSMSWDDVSITNMFESQKDGVLKEYFLMKDIGGHPNVVNCDDVSEIMHSDGMGWDIYIRMELLKPMTDHIQTIPGEQEVIQVGLDLCSALVLCEKHKIIHRDIKPQNIFISPNGDYKLGDFGIARTIESATHGASTMGIGTNNYMAPEVRYGQENYSHTVDIYSLGLVLYWLLNEMRLPFYPMPPARLNLSDVQNAQHRRMRGDAIPAPKYGSDALKAVVLMACAFDPKDRYQSAADMKKALEGIANEATPKPVMQTVVVPPVAEDVTVRKDPVIDAEDVTVSAHRPMTETKPVAETIEDTGDCTVVEKQTELQENEPTKIDEHTMNMWSAFEFSMGIKEPNLLKVDRNSGNAEQKPQKKILEENCQTMSHTYVGSDIERQRILEEERERDIKEKERIENIRIEQEKVIQKMNAEKNIKKVKENVLIALLVIVFMIVVAFGIGGFNPF